MWLSIRILAFRDETIFSEILGALAGDVCCAWPVPNFLSFFLMGCFGAGFFSPPPFPVVLWLYSQAISNVLHNLLQFVVFLLPLPYVSAKLSSNGPHTGIWYIVL